MFALGIVLLSVTLIAAKAEAVLTTGLLLLVIVGYVVLRSVLHMRYL